MFRTTSIVISILLLCLLFIPAYSVPSHKNVRNGSSSSHRQKRTFGLGLFGSRDWSPFYQSWRMPTYTTMPNFVHVFSEEELYHNMVKKMTDLEIGQQRIIDYLQKLYDYNNANPCEARRTESTNPTPTNVPQLAIDADVLYREPLTTTTTTTTSIATAATTDASITDASINDASINDASTTTITSAISPNSSLESEESATDLSVDQETIASLMNEEQTSVETSSEENHESEEANVSSEIPFSYLRTGYSGESVESVESVEKNDVQ